MVLLIVTILFGNTVPTKQTFLAINVEKQSDSTPAIDSCCASLQDDPIHGPVDLVEPCLSRNVLLSARSSMNASHAVVASLSYFNWWRWLVRLATLAGQCTFMSRTESCCHTSLWNSCKDWCQQGHLAGQAMSPWECEHLFLCHYSVGGGNSS